MSNVFITTAPNGGWRKHHGEKDTIPVMSEEERTEKARSIAKEMKGKSKYKSCGKFGRDPFPMERLITILE